MEQLSILVVSDDPKFVNSLEQVWQGLGPVPPFAVSGTENPEHFSDVAVVVLDGQQGISRLVDEVLVVIVLVAEDEVLRETGSTATRVVQLRRGIGAADHAAILAKEILLRLETEQRAVKAEQRLRESERYAVLGRSINDSRHELGNALTIVLGNIELMLLSPGSGLRDEARKQLETIQEMSLRIYGILQRLSSLDLEMQVAERQAEREVLRGPCQAAVQQ